jgi:hypothetical protein
MEKYLIVYFGGKVVTDPKEREKMMAEWMKWFTDMGKSVVEMGSAARPGKLVSAKGVKDASSVPVSGYSVFQADNIDAVVALAKKCPIIAGGGEISISTIMAM